MREISLSDHNITAKTRLTGTKNQDLRMPFVYSIPSQAHVPAHFSRIQNWVRWKFIQALIQDVIRPPSLIISNQLILFFCVDICKRVLQARPRPSLDVVVVVVSNCRSRSASILGSPGLLLLTLELEEEKKIAVGHGETYIHHPSLSCPPVYFSLFITTRVTRQRKRPAVVVVFIHSPTLTTQYLQG
jgi:hypothetical protein